jgi:hypothetical protein
MAKGKTIGLTLRLDEDIGRMFTALVSLNGTNATDVLRSSVLAYVEENKKLLNIEELQKRK